jgi:hypothetical protein
VHLEGLTGTGGGVIGALAAAGLRAGGDDGRFLWLPGLRGVQGVFRADQLRERLLLDAIETEQGRPVEAHERVDVGDWPRPLMRRGRSVLLVEETTRDGCDWIVVGRSRIKQLSE